MNAWAQWGAFLTALAFGWGFFQGMGSDAWALTKRCFMPGCMHAGVVKGTTCPLCGRTA